MNVFEIIKTRRSIRKYLDCQIDNKEIKKLIEAAICAPSGKNCQPWKFAIISDALMIERISKLSRNYRWMRRASRLVIVFLDNSISYHYKKDIQSCGAAIQNILLTAHSMGIGSCWVGDIIDSGDEIKEIIGMNIEELEIMGIVTLGYSEECDCELKRRKFESFILGKLPD